MINGLINYIYTILFYVIFVVILEMLLPKGNNSKYVKLVLGLVLTFIVISPITKVFSSVSDIKNGIQEELAKTDVNYTKSLEVLNQDVYIDNILTEGLKTDIKNRVEDLGYIADNIEVEYEKNEKGEYGQITYISFNITNKKENKDDLNVKSIQDVEIQVFNNEESIEADKIILPDIDKQKIIENIANRYEIDMSKINII